MTPRAIETAIACVMLAFCGFALAQSTQPTPVVPTEGAKKEEPAGAGSTAAPANSKDSFTHGESKRCASLTGADKDQCDKEEATKTEGAAAQDAPKPADASTKQ